MRILVTGGTGFLGKFTVSELKINHSLALISRKTGTEILADLTRWDAAMDIESIKGKYDLILHLAGLYDLRASYADCLMHNVVATHNALTIAQKAQIPHFVHASTVAVTTPETVDKNCDSMIDTSSNFPDGYSYSKAHAENLVRSWSTHDFQSRTILRLGILVGDTRDGKIERIDGPYHTPEFMKKWVNYSAPFILPDSGAHRLPLVPVDVAAKAISKIVDYIEAHGLTGVHGLYLTPKTGVSASELYSSTMKHLNLNQKLITTSMIPKTWTKKMGESFLDIPKEELEYMLALSSFNSSKTESWIGSNWCPEFGDYEMAFWRGYEKFVSNR